MAIWVSQRPLRATVVRAPDRAVRVPRGDPILARATGCATPPDSVPVEPRSSTGARRRDPGGTSPAVAPNAEHTRARIDPDASAWHLRRRPVRDRTDRPVLAHGRPPSRHRDRSSVIVHPKIYDLVGPQGAVRVVENESVLRRSTADPMSGFVSMREYVAGDDPRMIHWPTTARTGTLMVREHVEVRRPEFTVVLDTAPTVGHAGRLRGGRRRRRDPRGSRHPHRASTSWCARPTATTRVDRLRW